MDLELMNMLSGLDLYGYYEPSKEMVVAHFFGQGSAKPNVIAFLGRDLSWDVREITGEKSKLYNNREIVIIEHRPISIQPHGSQFDELVRKGLESMARQQYGEDAILEEKDPMFGVLAKRVW